MSKANRTIIVRTVATAILLLVPAVQWLWSARQVDTLTSQKTALEKAIAEFEGSIESLRQSRSAELNRCGTLLDDLDKVEAETTTLLNQTSDVEKKIETVKKLRNEYVFIQKSLDQLKQEHPELTSGL